MDIDGQGKPYMTCLFVYIYIFIFIYACMNSVVA